MTELRDKLQKQYRRLAMRYGELLGPPPPMPLKEGALADTIHRMRSALLGERHPEAGDPKGAGRIVDLWLDGESVEAVVELVDAMGRRAGIRRITLPTATDEVRALYDRLAVEAAP